MKMAKENLIEKRTFEFALSIIQLYKELINEKEFIISKQLLRSGTSIGANVSEGTAGQSKKDFIAKMSIASKEARESKYWLKLLSQSNLTKIDLESYLNEIDQLIKILTSIVKTAQENSQIIQNS
jgi:four helix bundle protein